MNAKLFFLGMIFITERTGYNIVTHYPQHITSLKEFTFLLYDEEEHKVHIMSWAYYWDGSWRNKELEKKV